MRTLHVHVPRNILEISAVTVRSLRMSSFFFFWGGGNTFTTFEMTICIRVSTNNYKLSVISLMLRDNKVKYTSTDVTYYKQGLQMII